MNSLETFSLDFPTSFSRLLRHGLSASLSLWHSLSYSLSLSQLPYVAKGNRIEAGNGIGWGLFSAQEVARKKLIPMPKHPPSTPPPPSAPRHIRVRVTTAAKQLMLCQKTRK